MADRRGVQEERMQSGNRDTQVGRDTQASVDKLKFP